MLTFLKVLISIPLGFVAAIIGGPILILVVSIVAVYGILWESALDGAVGIKAPPQYLSVDDVRKKMMHD